MPVIYLDILIIMNWLIDCILLHATAYWLRLPHRTERLVLAGAVGGLSACLVLVSVPVWISVIGKIGLALLICTVAFSWRGIRFLLRCSATFFIVSAAFAGVLGAIWFFAAPQGMVMIRGIVYYDMPAVALIALIVAVYLLMRVVARMTSKTAPPGQVYKVTVARRQRRVQLDALFDTGASPIEIFSGKPVFIAQRDKVAEVLPSDFPEDLSGKMPVGIRLIPVTTITGECLLPAFLADWICIGTTRISAVYVAVTDALECDGCHALFGKDLAKYIKEW